jgi:hypothetical protein
MKIETMNRKFLLFTLGFGVVVTALAQGPITARTTELPLESPYVTVNLDRVANDTQAAQFPSDRILCQTVPFDLPKKGAFNCLFLKPIGWSAAKNEDAEYPGYIANYDNWRMTTNDVTRAMVPIPVGDYKAIWLLAATDNNTNLTDSVTLRMGMAEGQGPVRWQGVTARVARANAAAGLPGTVVSIPNGSEKLYLVNVPFAKAIAQDFKEARFLWLDFTKDMKVAINLPDPNRFQLRPLGEPSGVRIYGVTLERGPFQMEMTATEPGNVFNEPEIPTFKLKLANVLGEHWIPYTIKAEATADDGTVVSQVQSNAFRSVAWVYGSPVLYQTVSVPVPKRGVYDLKLSLIAHGALVTSRETTFAVLAPDTRKYREESPFGTWDFAGCHATASDPDLRGPLYVKAGLRYGMADQPPAIREKYGLIPGNDRRIHGTNDIAAIQKEMTEDPTASAPPRALIFHECGVSGSHMTRIPDLFSGRPPYKFNADEEKTWKTLWDEAREANEAIRKAFPKTRIYFGNTTPHLLEEFLKHGWKAKDLDIIGNESGSFMRLPETQPCDFVSDNACIWMLRQIADKYGCKDVPIGQCLEICYPCSGPGNLSEMTQAAYLVRHNMHSLSWGIPVIRPMCLTDMGNSYYHSNWGSTGLCRAWPNVSPKPAYVAYATLTQVLDGAKFTRWVPLKSTAVYAAEFQRKDKKVVTCFWTIRGRQNLTVEAGGARKQALVDLMGRESEIEFKDNQATMVAAPTPCYLITSKPIKSVTLGEVKHDERPGKDAFTIATLGKLADWTVETARSTELETYNFINPRRKGDFAYKEVGDFEGESGALEVKPKLPCEGSQYLQMYSVLALNKPVEIPGQPTEIGVMVNGNGGWGRVIFELEDAGGQRWISIGAEQAGVPNSWMADWLKPEDFAKLNPKSMNVCDWNSDDAWGVSSINHDGWRYIRFPLPGQYPGDNYHWPKNSQWRFSGDGVVKYPLKFKKLVVTMPEKVLYGTQYIPPARTEIYLKDLMATYDPVEKVFAGK